MTMDDFLIRALVAGIGVAVIAGPLGVFVVWRRMAYFGSALSHAALLGVALGLLLNISPIAGVAAVCVAVAFVMTGLGRARHLGGDTVLGILSHAALALGLVAVAFLESARFDLMAYLFGDILAVSQTDIIWIYAGGAAVLGVLIYLWRPLLSITVHEELAEVEGVPTARVSLAFMVLLAIVVALAMKVVGVLLVTSLLIIPAAAARPLSRTPEVMAVIAAIIGAASVAGGLWGSFAHDIPAGPAIVVAATVLFAVGMMVGRVVPQAGSGNA